MSKNIMITGGAGFIGSHVVRLFVNQYPQYQVINLDALTYAGNLENLKDIENKPNYRFVKANILDSEALEKVFDEYSITDVIHLAAESHVDRSIVSPLDFVRVIEKRQSQKIGCIEEVAYRMGYINREQLTKLADKYAKSGYGEYLHRLKK